MIVHNSSLLRLCAIDACLNEQQLLYEHPEAASGDPTLVELSYKRWIEVPSDVRMIGVASSGVELNLRILTAALKSRYLRTQTVLYPVVEKIRTFMTVHTFYLDYLEVRCFLCNWVIMLFFLASTQVGTSHRET